MYQTNIKLSTIKASKEKQQTCTHYSICMHNTMVQHQTLNDQFSMMNHDILIMNDDSYLIIL